MSTIDELFERKNSGFGLENRIYGRRDPSHSLRDTICPQKLALTSPTSGGGGARGLKHGVITLLHHEDAYMGYRPMHS
jgi:hypothetical protein